MPKKYIPFGMAASILPHKIIRSALISFSLAWREIRSHLLRSFITGLGILLGIGGMLNMVSLIRGTEADLEKNFLQMGGLTVIEVTEKKPATPEEEIVFSRSPGLSFFQGENICNEIKGLKQVIPHLGVDGEKVVLQGNASWCRPVAAGPSAFPIFNYELEQGRFFTDSESMSAARICILGKRLAERLSKNPQQILGKKILFRNVPFTIIGILSESQNNWHRNMTFIFPIHYYFSYLKPKTERIGSLSFEIEHYPDLEIVRRQLTLNLKVVHRGVEDFQLEIPEEKIEQGRKRQWVMSLTTGIIASIALLVGAVGIVNIMFATIHDRIREIGILKSIGASPLDIFLQFLIEAVVLSLSGGLLGIFAGNLLIALPDRLFPWIPQLRPLDYILALGVACLTGILSGIYPAFKASKINPVEALQYA